jgi:hypothetical protein
MLLLMSFSRKQGSARVQNDAAAAPAAWQMIFCTGRKAGEITVRGNQSTMT